MNIDPGEREHEDSREVERFLDNALAQYGMIEPRPGLEGRVLARLAEAQQHSRQSLRSWSAFGFSTAAALALALSFLGRPDRTWAPKTTVMKISLPPQTGGPTTHGEVGTNKLNRGWLGRVGLGRNKFGRAKQPITQPKLEQFPSPLPLTDQEKMLARYVREFPEKAVLVARAQTELRKEDEREMAAPWRTNTDHPEQQE